MSGEQRQNTIHEAVAITVAIANGERVQIRYVKGNGVWKDRTLLGELPDFLNYQYRIKPSAEWIIVWTRDGGHGEGAVWRADDLNRAIELATDANKSGRQLQYVIKVEGDVATIQKTPQ